MGPHRWRSRGMNTACPVPSSGHPENSEAITVICSDPRRHRLKFENPGAASDSICEPCCLGAKCPPHTSNDVSTPYPAPISILRGMASIRALTPDISEKLTMRINRFGAFALVAIAAMSSSASAAIVNPVFVDQGIDTTGTAESTRMYRADLTGLGLSEISAITVNDSNSGLGGSPGIYSGFDLDAIFLDIDGLLTTTADRIFATSFLFTAGMIRAVQHLRRLQEGPPTGRRHRRASTKASRRWARSTGSSSERAASRSGTAAA